MVKLSRWLRASGVALAIVLFQWAIVVYATGKPGPRDADQSLYQWDSVWYGAIADHGFWKALPAPGEHAGRQTVAWFPGYPLTARWFGAALGLPTPAALLWAARFEAWIFWTYLVLLLLRASVSWRGILLVVVPIVSYPSAFYMVSGYAESLFMASVVGFCFWLSSPEKSAEAWAAIHGFGASATRLVGLPLALVPLLFRKPGQLGKAVVLCALSSLGCVLFFAFYQVKFGAWDLYMSTQKTNWGISPDFMALIHPSTYRPCVSDLGFGCLDRSAVAGGAALLVGATAAILKYGRQALPVALLLSGWVSFGISVAGLATKGMESLIRYSFPSVAFVAVAMGLMLEQFPTWRRKRVFRIGGWFSVLTASAFMLWLQKQLIERFSSGQWVS